MSAARPWCGTVRVLRDVSGAAHLLKPHPPLQAHFHLVKIQQEYHYHSATRYQLLGTRHHK